MSLCTAKRKYVKLSEQMLLDCCINERFFSVKLMEISFQWLKKNGVMLESDYPYDTLISYDTCRFDINKSVMKIIGYVKLGNLSPQSCADEEEMKQFLIDNGPLIVGFNAGEALQAYTGGILDVTYSRCPSSGINTVGLLVGYGTSNGIDFWIVKNTWGTAWGEKGYFRIRRGKGTCGINCLVVAAKVSY